MIKDDLQAHLIPHNDNDDDDDYALHVGRREVGQVRGLSVRGKNTLVPSANYLRPLSFAERPDLLHAFPLRHCQVRLIVKKKNSGTGKYLGNDESNTKNTQRLRRVEVHVRLPAVSTTARTSKAAVKSFL